MKRIRFPAAAGLLAAASLASAGETLLYADLVDRMTDLEHVALLPGPLERSAMWSSYDRAAKYEPASGKYVKWYANGDGNGLIRREGDSQVIAEMTGPGVIWRIWSAKPEGGHLKIVIDGEPAIDMPFAHYFDAKHAPFDYPTLAYESARGKNLYFPIPYNRSCKVVAEKGWGRYYQITYTTYPPGTRLPRAADATAPATVAALKRVDDFFARGLGTDPAGKRDGQETLRKAVSAPAGGAARVVRLSGPRAITSLRAKAPLGDQADQMAALRRLVLRITWDGSETPAVWCPLGDFFGTAPGVNLYRSLPLGVTEEGLYSFWYMPFGRSALVELVNEGETARRVEFTVTHAPLAAPVRRYGRFHAKWHRDVMPVSKDRWPDWTVVRTAGHGRFCGMMLHVWNPRGGQCAEVAWAHGHYWWGEGDEKFFVDGETFPSTFGTGTEDYFGYAWGNSSLFQRPYHNQTRTQGNAGHQSLNRFQIVDNVPFARSFDGYLEKYYPNEQPTLYAAVAYWYLSADGTDPHGPTPVAERHGYYHRPPIVAGGFKVLGQTGGVVRTQSMKPFTSGEWTDDDHLWWTDAKPGDTLDIELPVAEAGEWELSAVMTNAVDYAVVQLYLDGRRLGEPIDLYNDGVVRTPPIPLGARHLTEGDHTLTVKIIGANARAKKAYMFGLDEARLERAE